MTSETFDAILAYSPISDGSIKIRWLTGYLGNNTESPFGIFYQDLVGMFRDMPSGTV